AVMVPMALALSEGGEQTAPLARAVIGGLLAATVATLFVLPTVFAVMQGRASTRSASLNPDDPDSSYYDRQGAEAERDGKAQPILAHSGVTGSPGSSVPAPSPIRGQS